MTPNSPHLDADDEPMVVDLRVDLRDPALAAFLAWLWPGAGHFYQRRWAKGWVFTICILGTFFYGLFIGRGKVVYASMRSNDQRLAYFCQLGAGLPALPALVQAWRAKNGMEPLFDGLMAPPKLPQRDANGNNFTRDELSEWHRDFHTEFELGTVFTMIAGLLNILAVYDAFAGPFLPVASTEDEEDDEEQIKKSKDETRGDKPPPGS